MVLSVLLFLVRTGHAYATRPGSSVGIISLWCKAVANRAVQGGMPSPVFILPQEIEKKQVKTGVALRYARAYSCIGHVYVTIDYVE